MRLTVDFQHVFDITDELSRMKGSVDAPWEMKEVNKDFTLSAMYPPTLIVPSGASLEVRVLCLSFVALIISR